VWIFIRLSNKLDVAEETKEKRDIEKTILANVRKLMAFLPQFRYAEVGQIYVKCLTNPQNCDIAQSKFPSFKICFSDIKPSCIETPTLPTIAKFPAWLMAQIKPVIKAWFEGLFTQETVKIPIPHCSNSKISSCFKWNPNPWRISYSKPELKWSTLRQMQNKLWNEAKRHGIHLPKLPHFKIGSFNPDKVKVPTGLKFKTATFRPEDPPFKLKSIYLPNGVKTREIRFTFPNFFKFANAKAQAHKAVQQGKQDRANQKAKEQTAKNHYMTQEAAMKKASDDLRKMKAAEAHRLRKAKQAEEKKKRLEKYMSKRDVGGGRF